MFKFLPTIFGLLITSFLAGSHPAPGQWSLTGQYLFVQPSVDDEYFVIESLPNQPSRGDINPILIGNERINKFDFASAFRVGLEYASCDCDREFGVWYTNLDTNHRKRVAGEFLSPTFGIEDFTTDMFEYEGRAASKISLDYKSLDLLVGQKIFRCCGLDFRVLCGLEFARLHFHKHIDYLPLLSEETYSSRVNQRANTRGVGLKVGLDFDYALCENFFCFPGCLNLNFFSTGSLLLGQCKARTNIVYEFEDTIYPYKIGLRKSNKVIPAFHIGAGLNYGFCTNCFIVDIGVGYEFNTYLNSLLTMKNIAYYGGGLTDIQYSDFDMQGLYVSLSVQF